MKESATEVTQSNARSPNSTAPGADGTVTEKETPKQLQHPHMWFPYDKQIFDGDIGRGEYMVWR